MGSIATARKGGVRDGDDCYTPLFDVKEDALPVDAAIALHWLGAQPGCISRLHRNYMNIRITSSLLALSAAVGLLAACGGGGGSATEDAAGAPGGGNGGGQAQLQWNSVSDGDLAGYRLYYGKASGQYLQARGAGANAGMTTAYLAGGLERGARYYFSITAYDIAGNESGFSPEVSKVIE